MLQTEGGNIWRIISLSYFSIITCNNDSPTSEAGWEFATRWIWVLCNLQNISLTSGQEWLASWVIEVVDKLYQQSRKTVISLCCRRGMSIGLVYLNRCIALPQSELEKLCPTFCFEEHLDTYISLTKIIICQEGTYLGMFSPWCLAWMKVTSGIQQIYGCITFYLSWHWMHTICRS